jgi:tetratricopeptide (TPR) repeat protein
MNETPPFPAYEEKAAPPVPASSYESFITAAEETLGRNELDKAFALYGSASESIPTDDKRQTRVLERQGLILIKQNNCARAKRFYSAAIRTAKKHNLRGRDVAGAYSGLAYCQEKSGDPDWAAANYRAAINVTDDAALKAELQKRLAGLKK